LPINRNILILSALGVLSACSSSSGPRFVPRPHIPVDHYTNANEMEDRSDRRTYNAYEWREACQRYRRIPRNSVETSGCMVMKAPPVPAAVFSTEERKTTRVTQTTKVVQPRILPIIHTETVYFDFNRSGIRADQVATIEKAVSEIDTYKPAQITVTGFTDRSGSVSYNEKLSRRRATSVSEALSNRGVVNERIDEDARGESDNAIPTADGVKMQANRRAVIDFRR
jgi:outer membrane protein OmpA-like peptidoglycan-associated protein